MDIYDDYEKELIRQNLIRNRCEKMRKLKEIFTGRGFDGEERTVESLYRAFYGENAYRDAFSSSETVSEPA